MKVYYFGVLTALMGISFVAGGVATALARHTVENWNRALNRPERVPPPPAYGWGWKSIYLLMGAAAWLVWLSEPQWGAPWVRLGMILYFVVLALNVLWSSLFFGLERPGAAFAAVLVQGLVTLAALIVFWNVWILPGALLIPVAVWTGYVALRNLLWWRHGGQQRPIEPEVATAPPGAAA